jgi:acyl-CoA synthetase (AMP-forming)/AMP-acid ligase II
MTSPDIVAAMMARALPPTTLTAVPLFHVSGLHAQLLTALRHGRRLVFMRRWNPQQALALIQKERITQFNGAPSMVMQLLAEPGFDDPAITGTLGGLGFGGAGLPQSLVQDVLVRRPNSMSGIGFGLTETNGAGAAISGRMFVLRPQAAGQLSPIISLRIVDTQGADLPPGEAGEIWLRGVSLMDGYWHTDPTQRKALADGWFQTGDIGRLDAEGYLHVVDRIKDVINRAGEKIASAEIESCLLAHPQVLEAAVFAQPDDHTGEAVVAVVVPRAGVALSAADIQAHVAAHLADQATRLPIVIIMVALFFLFVPSAFWIPSPGQFFLAVLTIQLGFWLNFLLHYAITLLCFWSERASALERLLYIPYLFLSGLVAPLEVFPPSVRAFALWTPFPYLVAFPAQLLSGNPLTFHGGFAAMAGWIALLLPLVGLLWRAGVRRYAAMGT